ncbi:MAG: hypothetical protein Q4C28_06000 [Escherichia coli]|nr:hypothetical protein [Escherichia coli]
MPDRLVTAAAKGQRNIPLFYQKLAIHDRIEVMQNFVMRDFLKPVAGMSIDRNSAAIEKKITDNTAAINDIMEAIVELASLMEGTENG